MFAFLKKSEPSSEPDVIKTASVSVPEDECFDNFVDLMEKLSLLFRKNIASSSDVISNVLRQQEKFGHFSGSMEETVSAIVSINSQIAEVNSFMENLDSAVHSSSAAIEQITSSVHNVADIVSERISITKELSEAAGNGSEKVRKVLGVIDVLSQNVDAIKGVIAAINEISEKTNLLAMNAAIEAAHAGKAGLGFAVVAGEIRSLSEVTRKNAADIQKTLKSMITTLSDAHITADEAGGAMKYIGGKVQETTESFNEITSEMESLSDGSDNILASVRTISGSSEDLKNRFSSVAANMNTIVSSTESGKASFDEIKASSEQISSLMSADLFNMNDIIQCALDIDGCLVKKQQEAAAASGIPSFPFTNIILKHLSWVTKVRALIDGKLSGEGITLGDHHACDLGKWIDTQAESLGLLEKPSFKALVASHEELHSVVHDVFNNLDSLSLSEREDRYSTLLEKSQSVIDNLVHIRSEWKTV